MQITEALLSEPGDIRRFVQQAVDHWPRLLAVHFTLHSTEGNIGEQPFPVFCDSFYRLVSRHNVQRSLAGYPSPPVVLRWLRERHAGATIRCLLLLSQDLFFHERYDHRFDEGGAQLVGLLQQAWTAPDTDRQCRVERCFRVARGDIPDLHIALKTVVQSLTPPVKATIIR